MTFSHKSDGVSALASDTDASYHFRNPQRKIIKLNYLFSVERDFMYCLRLA